MTDERPTVPPTATDEQAPEPAIAPVDAYVAVQVLRIEQLLKMAALGILYFGPMI